MPAAPIMQAVQMAADRIHREAGPARSSAGASAVPADVHTAVGAVVSRGLIRSSSSSLAPAGSSSGGTATAVGSGSSGGGAAGGRLNDSGRGEEPPERHEWMYRQALAVTA